ncbi:hypothetical protein J3R30DRAFT_760070 [Lentinula aciculospora]|uniref:Uncharacterized protein n=1 Tax=Lentinula aciculospora TaxID=153920 RepID=A0A9W9DKD1_9AGAR|nr:hypothetical protein J3R30DRAFT_760070 [Lentinula aciculospora]
MPSQTAIQQASSSAPVSHTSSMSAVIGAVVGITVAFIIIVLVYLLLRYRKRKAARFPRIDVPNNEDQVETYHDRSSSALESSVTHDPTRAHSAEHLLRSPPSASRLAVASSPTSSRPLLPHIITKQLPSLPPPNEESQSALKYTRSILSAVSKRFTTTAPVFVPQSGSTAESTTSSFFPPPVHEEDRGMLSISRQHSLSISTLGRTSLVGSDSTKGSRIGTYPGMTINNTGVEEARRFPVRPVINQLAASTRGENVQPSVTIETSRQRARHVPRFPISPTVISPQTSLSSGSYATKGKSVVPLMIITENSGGGSVSESSLADTEDNISSHRTSKRLSEGKLRVEKERQRRRRPKTPSNPQGPRPRPLPSPPASSSLSAYNIPLPSASSGGSMISEALSSDRSVTVDSHFSTRTTVQGHVIRRRRPLPQTSPDARRSSFIFGPHVLVPLKSVHHRVASLLGVESRALEISALIQSQPDRLKEQEEFREPKLPLNSFESTSVGSQATPLVVLSRTEDDDANNSEQEHLEHNTASSSPQLEWALPVLSSLLSLPQVSPIVASTAPSSALIPDPTFDRAAALRPRTGQLEHALSLPSSLPSRHLDLQELINDDNHFFTSAVTSTRGPLPLTPSESLSARSAPETSSGNKSQRSPRRLPPEPLHLKHTRTEPSNEIPNTPGIQYLTVSEDLSVAPPPYSGRHIKVSKIQEKMPDQRLFSQEEVSLTEAVPGQSKKHLQTQTKSGSTKAFMRRSPQSIPVTPSEWRTSSTTQSLATSGRTPRTSERQDETAAEMLFELLDDSGSLSSTFSSDELTTIQPLSIPNKPNRTLLVPAPSLHSTMSHPRAFSASQASAVATRERQHSQRQLQRESVTRVPRISLIPENDVPQFTLSRLPPFLRMPPPPNIRPPSLPPIPAPASTKPISIRSKVWNAQRLVETTASTTTSTIDAPSMNRSRSNSAPHTTQSIHPPDTVSSHDSTFIAP